MLTWLLQHPQHLTTQQHVSSMIESFEKRLEEVGKVFVSDFERWVEKTLPHIDSLQTYLLAIMESRANGRDEVQREVRITVPESFWGFIHPIFDFYKEVFTRWRFTVEPRIEDTDIFTRFTFKDTRYDAVVEVLGELMDELAAKVE